MDYNIKGKTVIVGGSSKGLGRACAIALAKEGVSTEEYEQKAVLEFPHRRYMDPQELGDFVCYLCSEQARSVTGTTTQIDGGLLSGLM